MKALFCQQFGPIADLVVTDVPVPTLAPGKVLIDVKAASLNFPDALMVQGLYQVKPPTPFVPGAEYAGEAPSSMATAAKLPLRTAREKTRRSSRWKARFTFRES